MEYQSDYNYFNIIPMEIKLIIYNFIISDDDIWNYNITEKDFNIPPELYNDLIKNISGELWKWVHPGKKIYSFIDYINFKRVIQIHINSKIDPTKELFEIAVNKNWHMKPMLSFLLDKNSTFDNFVDDENIFRDEYTYWLSLIKLRQFTNRFIDFQYEKELSSQYFNMKCTRFLDDGLNVKLIHYCETGVLNEELKNICIKVVNYVDHGILDDELKNLGIDYKFIIANYYYICKAISIEEN